MNRIVLVFFLTMLGAFSIPSLLFGQQRLTLEQSKELALTNNIALQNSSLALRTAKAVKENAFSNYFPKVSAMGFHMRAIDPLVELDLPGGDLPVYDGDPINLETPTQFAFFPGINMGLLEKLSVGALNVTQPIYTGGRITIGNKLAQIGIDISEKQQLLVRNEVLLKTEQQYWQLVLLQEKHKTLLRYETLLDSLAEQVNDAFQAGLIIQNDVLKVRLKQSELAGNKSKLENGLQLALIQFCQTTGIPQDTTYSFEDEITLNQAPASFYIDIEDALPHRMEYQLLEHSVNAQDLQIKLKKGEYLPQVAFGLSGYYLGSVLENTQGSFNGLAYATVSIPISDWWGGSHAIKEKELNKQIALNNFNDSQSLLKLQMEKAWLDLIDAYHQITIMNETIQQADENMRVTQDSYDNGIVTVSDLLEAQAIHVEAETNLLEAKTNYRLAITSYIQVTGR